MADHILRDEAIKQEMEKPWCEKMVSAYLFHMERWLEDGYTFTEEQRHALMELWERVKGGEGG